MAEYKKMKLEDVFADIEKIMGADASDEEKSMQLRKHAAGDSFPRRRELCEA